MQTQGTQNQGHYRSKLLTKWLPIYLVVGAIIYAIVYFVFLHHGSGGGGAPGGGGGY